MAQSIRGIVATGSRPERLSDRNSQREHGRNGRDGQQRAGRNPRPSISLPTQDDPSAPAEEAKKIKGGRLDVNA